MKHFSPSSFEIYLARMGVFSNLPNSELMETEIYSLLVLRQGPFSMRLIQSLCFCDLDQICLLFMDIFEMHFIKLRSFAFSLFFPK